MQGCSDSIIMVSEGRCFKVSIKKRLILSNIAMIIVPGALLLVTEIVLGYFLFVVFNGNPEGEDLKVFVQFRFIAITLILILTNGLLTYFMSRSIIKPISKLSTAAKKISEGDLEYSVQSDKKDELGDLANTFEQMRLKLREADREQKQYEQNRQELIASISHDLKTPLTSIKGYVKGIQDGVANTPKSWTGIWIRFTEQQMIWTDLLMNYFYIQSSI